MSTGSATDTHPGPYIRNHVLPEGMLVTEAARLLDVGRPALSNLLNGKAALSPEMAARLARAFGADQQELMAMQMAHDTRLVREKGVGSTRDYVPPFLQIKANQIEEWVSQFNSARIRMAVFLRTLVHSTGRDLKAVDFPGNDDGERPGADGLVEAGEASPWVPCGKSWWEFGVNEQIKKKADEDYAKSIPQLPLAERRETTFIFVTPRRWKTKQTWEKDQRDKKEWKDVRVFDANDLEQWLEQSIPAQAWFAHERHIPDPAQGVYSLDACWRRWAADCEPALIPALFDQAVTSTPKAVLGKLTGLNFDRVIVAADSRDEALAFLSCLFASDHQQSAALRDRIAVFTQPGPLSRLAWKSINFIPVITTPAVEKEFAELSEKRASIVIQPRSATSNKPDIELEPLGDKGFEKALGEMGCDRDTIRRLARESGRSLTVLRRRLSQSAAIQAPEWAADKDYAKQLVPFLWAGAWNSDNAADRTILSLFAHDTVYADLEDRFTQLRLLEDPPVWAVGAVRGLISKLDTLFAIHARVTPPDLEQFFDVAELVLSEEDPSLSLPEQDRWKAGIYGKTREISTSLRRGISETLVLLAIHGADLFKERMHFNPEASVSRLVRNLLCPLTTEKLESHSDDLPMYAEAAPETFLGILEDDLASPASQALELMRPASTDIFGRCPRTGLLWALENTAWNRDLFVRSIDVLARLAARAIDDNWANKPAASLSSIFRWWMPQTSAGVDERIKGLKYLARNHPEVAWKICIEQFDLLGQRVGSYSHKPRWRADARGHGEPDTGSEAWRFVLAAVDLALDWPLQTGQTLGDLIGRLDVFDEADQDRILNLIERWNDTASDTDRVSLREVLRVTTLSRRANRHSPATIKKVRKLYEELAPRDVVLLHAWLFKKEWIAEPFDGIEEEDWDYAKIEEHINNKRLEALRSVMAGRGLEGVLDLAESGDAAAVVGRLLVRLFDSKEEINNGLEFFIDHPLSEEWTIKLIVLGILHAVPATDLTAILSELVRGRPKEAIIAVLTLAPFNQQTWDIVEKLGGEIQNAYWKEARAVGGCGKEELQHAVDRLLEAGRPRAAFATATHQFSKLNPKQLFRLVNALAMRSDEPDGTYPPDSYNIGDAFKALNLSGEIPRSQMAGLEFLFIQALDHSDYGIPNLQEQIEEAPDWFVQVVAFVFKRKDGKEDPEHLRVADSEQGRHLAERAFALLEALSAIPGKNDNGTLEPDRIIRWINAVRAGCTELGRGDVGDGRIGQLLAKAPIGEDGVWPCEPVRDAIEQTVNGEMSNGISVGLLNSRGAYYRGCGGEQERELAAQYAGWARSLEFTHPKVARILQDMGRRYEHDAVWWDNEAKTRDRLIE